VVQQAGQVWFPDSAYKTATMIKDLQQEELPLFVIANWRGFSGGMRDMYNEILKFGAMIVEHLTHFTRPVFVYIPRHGELRGGAWVVIDPNINSNVMEMYVDPDARGGVLEPAGTVEIKMRRPELLRQMKRLDTELQELGRKLTSAPEGGGPGSRSEIEGLIKKRQELLLPVYQQVAVAFADLHDTPRRMLHKGCVHAVVPWKRARSFFYWRLRRRLWESDVARQLRTANPHLTEQEAKRRVETLSKDKVEEWKGRESARDRSNSLTGDLAATEEEAHVSESRDDKRFVSWSMTAEAPATVGQLVRHNRSAYLGKVIEEAIVEDATVAAQAIAVAMDKLPSDVRGRLLADISAALRGATR